MAAEFRDDDTAKHTIRMGRYCELLAQKSGMPEHYCKILRTASPMHDVGKIGISDNILLKPGKLTPEEFDIVKKHCEFGYKILVNSNSEFLEVAAIIALSHHEKYDGSGYPKGLTGEDIPFEGRVAAVCDVFDALTTDRVYKSAYSVEKALSIMKEGRRSHFDPILLDIFLTDIDDFLLIKERFIDT